MTKGEVIEYIIKNTDIIHDNKRDEILEYYYNLQQENQQLKEQLKDEENWRVKIAKENSSNVSECLKLIEQKKQYKSVLDEIREYINARCLEKDGLVGYGDDLSPIELMEILDKVKE